MQLRDEMKRNFGTSTLIDLFDCDPFMIKSEIKIRQYVIELCDTILLMERFGDCEIKYFGEDPAVAGFSMKQFIVTSLVSAHFVDHDNASYIDIFSCKGYDVAKAVAFSRRFFCAKRINYKSFKRG